MKYIIDCDPGIDDTMALFYFSNHFQGELLAMTSTHGNSSIENTTNNLIYLNDKLGLNVKIGKGTEGPLIGEVKTYNAFHGKDGFGEVFEVDSYDHSNLPKAWDLMYDSAKEAGEKITIINLGPLTNLALAMKKYPDMENFIEEIFVMGGTTFVGNEGPHSEANFANDALAVEIVLQGSFKKTFVGLNATDTTNLDRDEIETFANTLSQNDQLLRKVFQYYIDINKKYGYSHLTIHDLATMFCVLNPNHYTKNEYPVNMVLSSGLNYGRMIVDRRPYTDRKNNAFIAETIDKKEFFNEVLKMKREI